jgi:hypothetical protein
MNDRDLLEAKYTAPSGKEFIFFWEKQNRTTELKTGVFPFPDRDGAHVQHQGGGAISYAMTCIFNGDNHVNTANDFELALHERDIAELQHPVYGIKKVIPTGNISRDNDLISSINESTVTVTFTETIISDPVNLEAVTADELAASFDELLEAAAADFAASLTVENISEILQIQSSLNVQTNILNNNLSALVPDEPSFLTTIGELKSSIKSMFKNAEKLTVNSLNTARLALNAMKLPSKVSINVLEKMRGYTMLIMQIQSQFRNDPFGINNIKNAFASTRLVLSGAVASIALGSALGIAQNATDNKQEENKGGGGSFSAGNSTGGGSGGILSRESAVATALQLKELLSTIQNYEDEKIEKNNFIDSNATAYFMLNELIYNSINLIFHVALSLPMKRIIKLDYDRNIIELCAEIYGSVDNFYIDKLIVENNLSIDDLEIIPMGREVFYYV